MDNCDEVETDDGLDIFGLLDEDSMGEKVSDDVDVERIVSAIKKCSREVDFLKKLKVNRVKPIDDKIDVLTKNQEKLKDFAISLMSVHFPNRNTVDFPGVGKLTKRKTKGKWKITDEDDFIAYAKDHGQQETVVLLKEVINKKKLAKAMSEILKTESEESIVGIKFVKPERDISLVVRLYSSESNDSKPTASPKDSGEVEF